MVIFQEVARTGNEKTQVPFCTEMSSQQLDLLHKSVGHISRSISEMAYILNGTQVVEEQPIDITDLYIIPILPDINVSSSQSISKPGLSLGTMFSQATHIAIQASHVYRHTGQ
ncbi:hypothetical protein H4Q26_001601 [Puccinia striiformis f. sp. tritici PST-130]|nr:hypothetical protein H4Q26_001601 [Puccinia striiformis f. sp. tritici PST-130]